MIIAPKSALRTTGMSRIPQHIIDQILKQTDIVDVISSVVDLNRAGANLKACCPFHQEKTPSFVVSPQKQLYHCFGCGVGGNVLTFLKDYEKLDFIDAVKRLAAPLNIRIETSGENRETGREVLTRVNTYAQWFFQNEYKGSDKARAYVTGRQISEETLKTFELGYAPDSFHALLTYLRQKKIPEVEALKLGLIKQREGGTPYDFYRDRLIFPIRNIQGEIIGFGGRTLSDNDQAKYINSPENLLYHKGRELFGLFQAKKEIARLDEVIVVEGYIDVLACFQLGLRHVVAPLGTSLTENHVRILKRYAGSLVIMFDGDEAGKKAAIRAIQTCFKSGIHPAVVILPGGKDPGDYLKEGDAGQGGLTGLLQARTDAMDWLFSLYLEHMASQPTEKSKILNKLNDWLLQLPDPFERGEYQKRLSLAFDVAPPPREKNLEITRKSDIQPHPKKKDLSLEAWLLFLFASNTAQFGGYCFEDLVRDFGDAHLKELAQHLLDFAKKHETFILSHAIQAVPDHLKGVLSDVIFSAGTRNADDSLSVESCVDKFNRHVKKRKLKEITAGILQAELAHDKKKMLDLLREKQQLLQ